MTHIIELNAKTEATLTQKALQRGISVENYIRELVERDLHQNEAASQVELSRKAAIRQARGMLRGDGKHVERLLSERRAEAELEMQQAEARDGGSKR